MLHSSRSSRKIPRERYIINSSVKNGLLYGMKSVEKKFGFVVTADFIVMWYNEQIKDGQPGKSVKHT